MNKVNGKRKLANLSYFCKCSGRVDLASKKLPKLSKLSLETLKLSKRLDISNMFRHLKRTNPKTHNMWLHVYTKRIDTFITNRKTQTQINQPKHVPHQLQLSYSRSRGHGLSVSHPKINLYIYIYILFASILYILVQDHSDPVTSFIQAVLHLSQKCQSLPNFLDFILKCFPSFLQEFFQVIRNNRRWLCIAAGCHQVFKALDVGFLCHSYHAHSDELSQIASADAWYSNNIYIYIYIRLFQFNSTMPILQFHNSRLMQWYRILRIHHENLKKIISKVSNAD